MADNEFPKKNNAEKFGWDETQIHVTKKPSKKEANSQPEE